MAPERTEPAVVTTSEDKPPVPDLSANDLLSFMWEALELMVHLLENTARVEKRYGLGLSRMGEAYGSQALLRMARDAGSEELGRFVQFAVELQEITSRAPDINALPPDEKVRAAADLRRLMDKYKDLRRTHE